MTPNLTFCCDTPGCRSTCTLHPEDAKTDPAKALEARGWQVTGAQGEPGVPVKVTGCICSVCAMKKVKDVPVHTSE